MNCTEPLMFCSVVKRQTTNDVYAAGPLFLNGGQTMPAICDERHLIFYCWFNTLHPEAEFIIICLLSFEGDITYQDVDHHP